MRVAFRLVISAGLVAVLLHAVSIACPADLGGGHAAEWRLARVGQVLGTSCVPGSACTFQNLDIATMNACDGIGGTTKVCPGIIPACGNCYGACVVTGSVYVAGNTLLNFCAGTPTTCGGLRDGVGTHIAQARRFFCDVTSSGCKCGTMVFDRIDCPQVASPMPLSYCF